MSEKASGIDMQGTGWVASAPGKLVLLGDYAVLTQGEALVAAVSRRAEGRCAPVADAPSLVVKSVLETGIDRGLPEPEGVRIDTHGFYEESGQKLGIGSSAAVAVVTAGLMCKAVDESCFALALDGHRRSAGGVGSGIDVAASFYGGVISTAYQPASIHKLPTTLSGLYMGVLYANQSASTRELVVACRASSTWSKHTLEMNKLTGYGISAWGKGEAEAFLSVVREYGRVMERMGQDAGVPVVTDTIARIMDESTSLGAAAKPSGAGGGDVVVVFSPSSEVIQEIALRARVSQVDVDIDPNGLRVSTYIE